MTDDGGNGLCCKYGWGGYSVFLEGEELFRGGEFSNIASVSHKFETEKKGPPTVAPTRAPTKPPTQAPTVPPTSAPTLPPTDTCVDDPTYRYKVKKCSWIALKNTAKRCEFEWEGKLVKQSCPVTCGLCDETTGDVTAPAPTKPPTPSPTKSPVVGNDNDSCIDVPDYRYKGVKKCLWVVRNTAKRCDKQWEGKLVKQSCPVTCGLCDETTGDVTAPAPTKPPTPSPTKSPVVGNDNDSCIDVPDYRYKGVKKCSWVAQKTVKRCDKQWDGKVVKESCRATCNVC